MSVSTATKASDSIMEGQIKSKSPLYNFIFPKDTKCKKDPPETVNFNPNILAIRNSSFNELSSWNYAIIV